MNVIKRIKDIVNSNINSLINKTKNPDTMLDEHLRDSIKHLAAVKLETARVLVVEEQANFKVNALKKEIEELTEFAKKALKKGDRNDAESFLLKRTNIVNDLPKYIEMHEVANENASQMKELYNNLLNEVRVLESRKEIMKGKLAATKARDAFNKIGANSMRPGMVTGVLDELESKVNDGFYTTMAETELLNKKDEIEELKDKYGSDYLNLNSSIMDLEKEMEFDLEY